MEKGSFCCIVRACVSDGKTGCVKSKIFLYFFLSSLARSVCVFVVKIKWNAARGDAWTFKITSCIIFFPSYIQMKCAACRSNVGLKKLDIFFLQILKQHTESDLDDVRVTIVCICYAEKRAFNRRLNIRYLFMLLLILFVYYFAFFIFNFFLLRSLFECGISSVVRVVLN